MKSILKFGLPVVLILSFFTILLISPDDGTYLSRYAENQYILVKTFDAPRYELTSFSMAVSGFQSHYGTVKKSIDQVRILVNKSVFSNNMDYIRNNLDAGLMTDPGNGRVSLEIRIRAHLFYFRGEGFNIISLFEKYKNLFDEKRNPLFLVQIPDYYQLESAEQ